MSCVSYTPTEEQMTEPKEKLLEAMDGYMAVLRARAASGNWKSTHENECINLHDDLMKLRQRVKAL